MKAFFQAKILLIVAAVCAIAYMGVNHFQNEKEQEKPIDNLPVEERLNVKKNIIVMGVDERSDDVGRSDTLFVVMFDTDKKVASLLSVPRDTRVRIQGYGWDKINHAYAYGGRELTQKTTEELLGIKINNYVMVDFKGFNGVIDAIGGVDIDIEKDMYYYDDWDGFEINLKKGRQHLDGKTAIQYVRYRDEEGDIGRIRRQQHFMMAVYDKIASGEMILHIPGLAKQLTTMVKTDLPLSDMINIGRAIHSMVKEQGLAMATVPGEGRYIDDISYYLPDIKALRKQMADMQGAEMTERYKSAADLMAREYDSAVEKAEQGDKSDENKDTIKEEREKTKKTEKVQEKKAVDKKKDAQKVADNKNKSAAISKNNDKTKTDTNKNSGSKTTVAPPARSGTVVRLVNCSGSKVAGQEAARRLRNAGFTVIGGGSGEVQSSTIVVSTTNNGSVVGKLSKVPFSHSLRITRDGAADCDGVILLGADFK